MTHIDSGMSKPGLPDDAEGQKKLDDFKDKVEEASPPNPPTPPDSEEKKEIVNQRPRTRKARVEERERAEVEQAFREVEQKVSEGIGEDEETRRLGSRLKEHQVPIGFICTIIIKEKKKHPDIWKLGPRNTYKWLSPDCKDNARAEAGRIGGLATAAKNAERAQAKKQEIEKAEPVPDSIAPPIPPPAEPEAPEPVIEALGILSTIFAEIKFSKPRSDPDVLLKISSANLGMEGDYPRPPRATYLLECKSGFAFGTMATAAL